VEQNALRISGVLEKQYPPRVSPAGVAHQDLLVRHRSRQLEDGMAREVSLGLVVHLASGLVDQARALRPGDRSVISGFLASAGHREPEKPVPHAQTLPTQD